MSDRGPTYDGVAAANGGLDLERRFAGAKEAGDLTAAAAASKKIVALGPRELGKPHSN
jgi:hypothetical protein